DDDELGLENSYGSVGARGLVIENTYDRSRNKGNCEEIPRHSFRTMYVWDVPFGHGRAFLGRPQGLGQTILSYVIGGWTWSGYFQAQSGGWMTPWWTGVDAQHGPHTSQTYLVPDRVCDGNIGNRTPFHMFDPTCFVQPANGRYGNSGFGILEGIGWWNY